MVATFKEGIDLVVDTLSDNWNRGNTANFKPVIIDIAEVGAERGKSLAMDRTDYVLVFETAHNEETPELLYDFVTTRINITVDMEPQGAGLTSNSWRTRYADSFTYSEKEMARTWTDWSTRQGPICQIGAKNCSE